MDKPKFKHDCDKCIFLFSEGAYDYYKTCKPYNASDVLLRYGSGEGNYSTHFFDDIEDEDLRARLKEAVDSLSCRWENDKFKPCNKFEPSQDSVGIFCKGCKETINKPIQQHPIIKKSGGTWVARFEAVDYFYMYESKEQPKLFHFNANPEIHHSWKLFSGIEITDEIAKLSPLVVVTKDEEEGEIHVLLRVLEGDYVVYDKNGNPDCYIADPEYYRLATVNDLED